MSYDRGASPRTGHHTGLVYEVMPGYPRLCQGAVLLINELGRCQGLAKP